MCHITYSLNVNDKTFISGGKGDGGGVTGEKGLQIEAVSTFVRVKPLDTFNAMVRHLWPCLWRPKQVFLSQNVIFSEL